MRVHPTQPSTGKVTSDLIPLDPVTPQWAGAAKSVSLGARCLSECLSVVFRGGHGAHWSVRVGGGHSGHRSLGLLSPSPSAPHVVGLFPAFLLSLFPSPVILGGKRGLY